MRPIRVSDPELGPGRAGRLQDTPSCVPVGEKNPVSLPGPAAMSDAGASKAERMYSCPESE